MTREHCVRLRQELDTAVLDMGGQVVESVGSAMCALRERDFEAATRLVEDDTIVDRKRHQIEQQCVTIIATQQPAAKDLRAITGTLSIATELERIGDYSEGVAKLTLRMVGEPVIAPSDAIEEMTSQTQILLRLALSAFEERDLEKATAVWSGDDAVDAMYENVFRDLVTRMAQDPGLVRGGTYWLWVAHNLERMADRATNIVESIAFIVTGDVEGFRMSALAQSLPR